MALDSKQVRKPVRKLRKLLKKIPKNLPAEQVHNLRTNTRRLEAMMASLSLDSGAAEKKLLKDLSAVRKKAGKVRDMDVLTGFAAALHSDGERDCKVRLIEHLGAMRRKQGRKLHAIVTKKSGRARGALKKTSRRLEIVLCERSDNGCDPAQARANAAATALALEADLANPPRLGRDNLHAYRLKVKQLQNVLRLAEGSGDRKFLEALNATKDAIGEWHDWEELLRIAKQVLDHGPKCQLVRELKTICERKYATALGKAEKMRKSFILSADKQRRGLQRVAKPVWTATAAIAA